MVGATPRGPEEAGGRSTPTLRGAQLDDTRCDTRGKDPDDQTVQQGGGTWWIKLGVVDADIGLVVVISRCYALTLVARLRRDLHLHD